MIPAGRKRLWQASENGSAVVNDLGGFTVHQRGSRNHLASEYFADRLMAKAYPQDGNLATEVPNRFEENSGVFGAAGAGRQDQRLGPERLNLLNGDLIIAAHLKLRAQFAKNLDEVVGERIVVIEYEDHISDRSLTVAALILPLRWP